MMIQRLTLILLVLASSTLGGTARADDSSEAALQFELGQELYRQRRYGEALERFIASNRLVPNAGVVYNIAQTYQLLHRWVEAYNWYESYLLFEVSDDERDAALRARDALLTRVAVADVHSTPGRVELFVDRTDLGSVGVGSRRVAVSPGQRELIGRLEGFHDARGSFEAVRGEVVRVNLNLEAVLGSLRVESTPVGATVTLADGTVLGSTPLEAELPVGPHVLRLTSATTVALERSVVVRDAEQTNLEVTLERAASRVAVLTVSGDPADATVVLDGEVAGSLPLTLDGLLPGERSLRVLADGHDAWETHLVLEAGGATRVEASLVETGAGAHRWRYAAYGVSASAIVIGVITGLLARGGRNAFFESPNPSGEDLQRVRRLNRTSDALVGIGALTFTVVFVWDLVRDRPASEGHVEIDR